MATIAIAPHSVQYSAHATAAPGRRANTHAGRHRADQHARRSTPRVGLLPQRLWPAFEQLDELSFGEHRHAKFFCLRGFRTSVVADYNVVGLLRHRPRGLSAVGKDRLLDLIAGESLE